MSIVGRSAALLERGRLDDARDQGGGAAVLRLDPLDDRVDGLRRRTPPGRGRGRRSAASRSGSGRSRGGARSTRIRFSSRTSVNDSPVISLPGGVDRLASLLVAPAPQRVEVLQGQARAGPSGSGTRCTRAGSRCRTSDSRRVGVRPATALPASSSDGMFGGGGGGRRAQDVVEDEQAALHRRGPVGFDVTARTVPCVSTPPRGLSCGQVDPAHLVALDALDPVVLRQPLVEERVVAVEQLQQAAVLRGRCARRASRSRGAWPGGGRRSARIRGSGGTTGRTSPRASCSSFFSASVSSSGGLRISSRNRARRRSASGSGGSSRAITAGALIEHRLDVAGLEPLADEVADELLRPRVGEHPIDLGRQVLRAACARRPGGTARRRASTTRGSRTAARPGRIRRPAGYRPGGPGSAASSRKRNRGEASTAAIAWATPASKVCPSWDADGLGQRRQPVHRRVVHRAAEGLLGEPAQELAGVAPASVGVVGHLAGEEAFVIRRPDPVPLVHRPAEGRRLDPERQRPDLLLVRRERLDLDRQLVRPGLPVAVELEAERLARPAGRTPDGPAPRRRPGRRAGTCCSRLTPST